LIEEIRDGVDILYFVGHGKLARRSGTPGLILQDEAGAAEAVKGQDLALRVGELQRGPRLVVLASCESAGDGAQVEAVDHTVQATLAVYLADAGVPAVIAMQGFVSMHTVETMMPVLFAELLRDGQIDRALAVARGKVRDHADWWMPALFSRLAGGQLWRRPSAGGDEGEEERAAPISREGRRVRTPGTAAIYLVMEGKRRHVPDPETYFNLFDSWADVEDTHDADDLPLGDPLGRGARLVQAGVPGRVYLDSNDVFRWITSPDVFNRYRFSWGKIRLHTGSFTVGPDIV
jgi:hypothetical protein